MLVEIWEWLHILQSGNTHRQPPHHRSIKKFYNKNFHEVIL